MCISSSKTLEILFIYLKLLLTHETSVSHELSLNHNIFNLEPLQINIDANERDVFSFIIGQYFTILTAKFYQIDKFLPIDK